MNCAYCKILVSVMPRGRESLTCRHCGERLDYPPSSIIRTNLNKEPKPGETVVCNVHDRPMSRKQTLLLFGSVYVDEDYSRARAFLFPYCGDPGLGGCGGVNHETIEINVCRECCRVQRQWLRDNPPFPKVLDALDALPVIQSDDLNRYFHRGLPCQYAFLRELVEPGPAVD